MQPFQSTRPCGARRVLTYRGVRWQLVSIHAPVWGATTGGRHDSRAASVFQSTRPCGARPVVSRREPPTQSFQSTRPCGARQPRQGRRRDARRVSIHAPVWGATTINGHSWVFLVVSIHAPVWGATPEQCPLQRCQLEFQSTRPCGARQLAACGATNERVFQSTRPCGARLPFVRVPSIDELFQSTRPCGARLLFGVYGPTMKMVSIHAPVWGATLRWRRRS